MDRPIGSNEATQFKKPAVEADRPDGFARDISAIKVGDCLLGYKAVQRRARGGRWNHFRGRMREIEKLIRHRHGDIVPEADDALIYVEVIASLALVEFKEAFVDVVLGWRHAGCHGLGKPTLRRSSTSGRRCGSPRYRPTRSATLCI